MILSPWHLRVDPAVQEEIQNWLIEEASESYDVQTSEYAVVVAFKGIDDAFRFRLQFDSELLSS